MSLRSEWEIASYLPSNLIESARDSLNVKVTCKFVVLERTGIRTLVVGTIENYPYHANLVDTFCSDHEIAASWIRKPDMVEILDTDVAVLGGGMIEIDGNNRNVSLYGSSTAYGSFKKNDLAAFVAQALLFEGFQITVS